MLADQEPSAISANGTSTIFYDWYATSMSTKGPLVTSMPTKAYTLCAQLCCSNFSCRDAYC